MDKNDCKYNMKIIVKLIYTKQFINIFYIFFYIYSLKWHKIGVVSLNDKVFYWIQSRNKSRLRCLTFSSKHALISTYMKEDLFFMLRLNSISLR